MASLEQCKTCEGDVSSEALTCPHCGQPGPFDCSIQGVTDAALKMLAKEFHPSNIEEYVQEKLGYPPAKARDFVKNLRTSGRQV